MSYFKQDFTNIMYGDLAEGHESRTRKESLLRGLRVLLAAQAALRQAAPEDVNEINHEIYWGTPVLPADLAVLKDTARFHIPPNEAVGADMHASSAGARLTTGNTPKRCAGDAGWLGSASIRTAASRFTRSSSTGPRLPATRGA